VVEAEMAEDKELAEELEDFKAEETGVHLQAANNPR
jgi:hypothetical protein